MLPADCIVAQTTSREYAIDGILARNRKFSDLGARHVAGWRYSFRCARLGKVVLGASECSNLSYRTQGSEDVVLAIGLTGTEDVQIGTKRRTVAPVPSFMPMRAARGSISGFTGLTLRVPAETVRAELAADAAFDVANLIDRIWLRRLPESAVVGRLILSVFDHVNAVGHLGAREREAIGDILLLQVLRLIEDGARQVGYRPRNWPGGLPVGSGRAAGILEGEAGPAPCGPSLTPRERETLENLAQGKSYRQISESMGVSLSTVQTNIRKIYEKLGARSAVQATGLARKFGLLSR